MGPATACVLGAGVVGLTAALELQERLPEATVTIIADKFNAETTSDGAAGLFYPFSSFEASTYDMTKKLVKESYAYYDHLLKTEGFVTGISETYGYILSNISHHEVENPLIENVVPEYRILTPEEIEKCPGKWKYGCHIKSLLIQCRFFLPWAMERFRKRGGKVMEKKILNFRDLIQYKFDVILNCTGLGARELCSDLDLVPVRGQVIKISAPWVKEFFLLDNLFYIVPGFETTLGGCKNYNNYCLDVEKNTSDLIWNKCVEIMPSLKNCNIIREWVGLRPHRVPIRLEPEIYETDEHTLKIVHNYGHGSQGITTAPGSAQYCVQYAIELLNNGVKS